SSPTPRKSMRVRRRALGLAVRTLLRQHRHFRPADSGLLLQSCEFARPAPGARNRRGLRPKRLRNNQLNELGLSKPTVSAIAVTGWSVSVSNLRAARKRHSCRKRMGVWLNASLNVWWKWEGGRVAGLARTA